MAKGRGRARERERERENAKSKLEKERETAKEFGNSLVISEQRDETMAKEFSAKMKMPSLSRLKCGVPRKERSLDVCLRLEDKTFMCFSIPGITTTLNTLSSSSKCHHHHPHRHNFDETPRPLDTNFDIGTNSFPVILADFKSPFPFPVITYPPFRSAVVGHTLFFVGANRHDIQGLDDIQTERTTYPYAPPSPPKRYYYSTPPPCNRISDQLYNLTKEYLGPPGNNFQTLTSYSSENSPWALNTSDNCFLDPTYTHTTTLTTPPTITGSRGFLSVTTNTTDPTPVTVRRGFLSVTTNTTDPTPVTERRGFRFLAPVTECRGSLYGTKEPIWTFDLHNPDLGWSEGNSLISPRIYPILVPYQGKLYAFSGNHPSLPFAEVYDPVSATWTELPPAPFRRLPDSRMYVVPLKGWNKLWVFGVLRPVDYTFDVLTQKWQKFTGSRDILPHFTDRYDLVSALTPEKHMVVYWINEQDVVYAYNLSTKQLFKGPISGIDFEEGSLGALFGFRHLRHDLFCLIGCTYLLDPAPVRTIVHVTLLQVSIKPLSKSSKPLELPKVPSKIDRARSKKICKAHPLTAAVVACFAYSLKGEIGIRDSYITSKYV